jgi:lipopolysaccharide transport system ATP-binding protein
VFRHRRRNGSGKSTLLKLICGVSQPTTGRIVLHGRPTLLAAMGVGMSGELTGRENIYINGGILGATDAEITKLFDEIVAFAELERFLDTR